MKAHEPWLVLFLRRSHGKFPHKFPLLQQQISVPIGFSKYNRGDLPWFWIDYLVEKRRMSGLQMFETVALDDEDAVSMDDWDAVTAMMRNTSN